MTSGAAGMALQERDHFLEYGESEPVHTGDLFISPLIREPEKKKAFKYVLYIVNFQRDAGNFLIVNFFFSDVNGRC